MGILVIGQHISSDFHTDTSDPLGRLSRLLQRVVHILHGHANGSVDVYI
jgi:hypothetical protein